LGVLKGLVTKYLCIIWCVYPQLKAALGLQSGKYDIHGSRKDTDTYRLLSLNISVSVKSTEAVTENIINLHRGLKKNIKPFKALHQQLYRELILTFAVFL